MLRIRILLLSSKISKKNLDSHGFCCGLVLKVTNENSMVSESDTDPLVRGADPDPYQNVTDPQHWCELVYSCSRAVFITPFCQTWTGAGPLSRRGRSSPVRRRPCPAWCPPSWAPAGCLGAPPGTEASHLSQPCTHRQVRQSALHSYLCNSPFRI